MDRLVPRTGSGQTRPRPSWPQVAANNGRILATLIKLHWKPLEAGRIAPTTHLWLNVVYRHPSGSTWQHIVGLWPSSIVQETSLHDSPFVVQRRRLRPPSQFPSDMPASLKDIPSFAPSSIPSDMPSSIPSIAPSTQPTRSLFESPTDDKMSEIPSESAICAKRSNATPLRLLMTRHSDFQTRTNTGKSTTTTTTTTINRITG
jgi:hypothetical protein